MLRRATRSQSGLHARGAEDATRAVGMWIWDVYAARVSPREMGDVKSECYTPYLCPV